MDAELALLSPEPLAAFNRAGVLDAADLRVALALCELSGHDDPDVILATALAVRAPRLGHVFVDLDTVAAAQRLGAGGRRRRPAGRRRQ